MQAEDRIIHFSAELIHRPIQPRKEALQKLYYELSQTRTAAYDSSDFTNPVQARFHSRRGQKTQSIALFLPDRAVLIEEWTDLALSDFLEKLREVATRLMAARGIQRYAAHTVTLRSTFALSQFEDARLFLIDHVCNQAGMLGPHFQRPVATGGLRFVLPETNEHPGNLHILIESFRHSRNEVFVEAKGVFTRPPLGPAELGMVDDHARYVRTFVTGRVFPFLNQYDVSGDASYE